jgi:hypothetical protein
VITLLEQDEGPESSRLAPALASDPLLVYSAAKVGVVFPILDFGRGFADIPISNSLFASEPRKGFVFVHWHVCTNK